MLLVTVATVCWAVLGQIVIPVKGADNAAPVCSCNCGYSASLGEQVYQQACVQEVIRDCSDIPDDGSPGGIYTLSPRGVDPFQAYCSFDGTRKWTVLQQRLNGNTPFDRIWSEYRNGFGVLGASRNFWLGLQHIYEITSQRQYILRVDLTDWDDSVHFAEYSLFYIGDEASKYAITLDEYSAGSTLQDDLTSRSQGTPFSARDQDNDSHATLNCARHFQTGWWHTDCYAAQVNGPYRAAAADAAPDAKGIIWRSYTGNWYSMKASKLSIRPKYDD